VLEAEACRSLLREAAAIQFVMDAFGHLKAIGATAAAQPLLERAGIVEDEGVTDVGVTFLEAATRRFFAREAQVRTLA
jgi:catalase